MLPAGYGTVVKNGKVVSQHLLDHVTDVLIITQFSWQSWCNEWTGLGLARLLSKHYYSCSSNWVFSLYLTLSHTIANLRAPAGSPYNISNFLFALRICTYHIDRGETLYVMAPALGTQCE